jgi:nicotinic acid phosphoribosyltransferase
MDRPQPGGRLVVRPDSGDPPVIVVQLLDILGEAFAEHCTKTSTGFKVLPPQIRIIQGDGISYETLGTILEAMKKANWAAENLAFGSGGALLQKLNRDTQKCAFKCSEITKTVDGKTENTLVYKVRAAAPTPLAARPPSPLARRATASSSAERELCASRVGPNH